MKFQDWEQQMFLSTTPVVGKFISSAPFFPLFSWPLPPSHVHFFPFPYDSTSSFVPLLSSLVAPFPCSFLQFFRCADAANLPLHFSPLRPGGNCMLHQHDWFPDVPYGPITTVPYTIMFPPVARILGLLSTWRWVKTSYPKPSVTNYQPTVHYIPKEERTLIHLLSCLSSLLFLFLFSSLRQHEQ